MINLKGLQDAISISYVGYLLGENSWKFDTKEAGLGATYLSEIYFASDKEYSGRFTVPVLYDLHTKKIVNNESEDILRILDVEFDEFAKNKGVSLFPKELQPMILDTNAWVYDRYDVEAFY